MLHVAPKIRSSESVTVSNYPDHNLIGHYFSIKSVTIATIFVGYRAAYQQSGY